MDVYGLGMSADMLLGKPTLHLPLNLIVQDMGDGKVVGVFQTAAGQALLMNSRRTHQLIIADAFIRPQLVFDSDKLRGCGVSHLLTSAFLDVDKWDGIFDRRNQ